MRKVRIWGLSAVLLVGGLGVSAATAADTKDSGDPPAAKSGWDWDVFGIFGSKDKPAAKTEKPKTKPEETARETEAPKPTRPDPATVLRQEQQKLARRLAVCDRLTEIALHTNDNELQRVAEQLNDRAYAIYLQRTANVGGGAALPSGSTLPQQTIDTHAIAGHDTKED